MKNVYKTDIIGKLDFLIYNIFLTFKGRVFFTHTRYSYKNRVSFKIMICYKWCPDVLYQYPMPFIPVEKNRVDSKFPPKTCDDTPSTLDI